jgi:hypothetical protein
MNFTKDIFDKFVEENHYKPKSPFSIEEFEQLEEELKTKIESPLKDYLLNMSREMLYFDEDCLGIETFNEVFINEDNQLVIYETEFTGSYQYRIIYYKDANFEQIFQIDELDELEKTFISQEEFFENLKTNIEN